MDERMPESADAPIDALDEQLLAGLADVVDRLDPVPPGLVDRIRFAVALDEVEVEVAHLLDSVGDHERDLAGVRSSSLDDALTMTFAARDVTVTLAIVSSGRDHFRLDGWLTGDRELEVVLRRPGETQRKAVADDGRFAFENVPAGMVQVIVEAPDADTATVVTPVFEL